MKPCAFVNQSLTSHSIGSMTWVLKTFDESYFKAMKRRMDALAERIRRGNNNIIVDSVNKLTYEDWKHLVLFLAAVHDIGKASPLYQDQFEDDGCKLKSGLTKSSFRYHEVLSGLYVYKLEWNPEMSNMVKYWSVLAVTNHLNAIRSANDIDKAIKFIKLNINRRRNPRADVLNLKEYGSLVISTIYESFNKLLDGLDYIVKIEYPSNYTLDDLEIHLKSFLVEKGSLKFVNKGYLLLLLPIIVGDNLDSSSQRIMDEESVMKSRFIKSLEVIYKW